MEVKRGDFLKGHIPWNRGMKGFRKGHPAYNKKPNSGSFKRGEPSPLRGKKNPKGSLAKMGSNNPMYGKFGKLSPSWKGGTSERWRKDKNSIKWRISVFERDGYKCQGCERVGVLLEAHHIKKWSEYPEFRLDINNGITLCRDCHKLTDNYGNRKQKNT